MTIQLNIKIRNSKPNIWRRFLVKETYTFYKLHEIIQVLMPWASTHLFEFVVDDKRISIPNTVYGDVLNAKKIKLGVLKDKQKFEYVYDFGDCWEHIILVEKFTDLPLSYPVCIKGKMNCPPDDSGGIYGYYELLDIKKDKNHPNYKENIIDWLGQDFDPEYFNKDEINKELFTRFVDGRLRYWIKK